MKTLSYWFLGEYGNEIWETFFSFICKGVKGYDRGLEVCTKLGEGGQLAGKGYGLSFYAFSLGFPQPQPCRLVHAIERLQSLENKLVHVL